MTDLISSLPDEVLGHILSFLTTKEAALTSILAKRWRNLLAFVRIIDIDDSVFLFPEEGKQRREGIMQSFMDFVDRVLALQGDSRIKKVSLYCCFRVDSDRVDRWIRNVMRRGVSILDLCVDFGWNYRLPLEIFKSRTLVKLGLGGIVKLDGWDGDGVIFLPRLKILDLDSVEICMEQFQILLRGCPVLKKLGMFNVVWIDQMQTVSSASLKVLRIQSDETRLKEFSFDTPNLVALDYLDYVAEDYPVVNLENVVIARINLLVDEDQVRLAREAANDDVLLQFSNVKKLVKGIRNVKKLFLSPSTLEVFSLCTEAMPVFNNLTFLAVQSHKDWGWQAMPVLLKSCPHLETLSLWVRRANNEYTSLKRCASYLVYCFQGLLHHETDKCGDACDCISQEEKVCSLSSCRVKRLDIKGFGGTDRELKMIKHFVESFPCLEEMEIHAERKGPTDFEIPGRLEAVREQLIAYNELTSCAVLFKWTAQ